MKQGEVTLVWIGGEHPFRLATYGQLRLLQEKCDAGPSEVLGRLSGDRWRVDDVREVIRIGLIGGGMDDAAAMKLVKASLDEGGGWLSARNLSRAILLAGLLSPEPDEVDGDGKKAGAGETASEATDALSSPPSTAPAPQSDTPRELSTSSPLSSSPPVSPAGTTATAASSS